jgi:hypothetical protein
MSEARFPVNRRFIIYAPVAPAADLIGARRAKGLFLLVVLLLRPPCRRNSVGICYPLWAQATGAAYFGTKLMCQSK